MPLQSSGAISLSEINTQFARGSNLNSYRGTGWFTSSGSSGNFPTGVISMSDFYDKGFGFVISSNQTNANLRTLAIAAGWNQTTPVIAVINSGVYISSNSAATPALTINGSFPNGVWLVNNGIIVGMAGNGANGGVAGAFGNTVGGTGGTALSVSVAATTVRNNGTIAGGGGGGGRGQALTQSGMYLDANKNPVYFTEYYGGGGGGGGRSSLAANSTGGTAGDEPLGPSFLSIAGSAGTSSAAGAGGRGSRPSGLGGTELPGTGGSGGDWGASGVIGGVATFANSGWALYGNQGPGGSGGAAVSGNTNITWLAFGTRLGGIS